MAIKNKQKLREELAKVSKSLREDFEKGIVQYVKRNEHMTYEEVGKLVGINKSEVSQICRRHGYDRPRGSGSPAAKGE